ncbi:Spermidine N(1)-acetyltransferase [Ruegeria denitrificans]|uniref:Spermidine N(1)-acetyltransferase n=1 Tax=Ruegeria denitrificans TaxID=1715692 RepID=A0A0P1IIR4_9RHOB|nr:GNAT family protein [Ruegeria denitrificans]CUJ97149.1 Spermidine N(1)-acetyltransferase [Ruegeria denitrificans]
MPDKSNSVFTLRPLEKADLEVITPWFQDIEDLSRFDRTSRIPLNLIQTEEIWRENFSPSGKNGSCWFVVESDSGQAMGIVGLEAISLVNRDAVIAMFVEKSARRLGLAIRATALLADFAFRQLGLNRLTSYYRQDNHISRDLVERLGCQVEGTMRQAWFADGTFRDMIVVGLLSQDWVNRRLILAKEVSPETIVTFGSKGCPSWSWPPQVDKCD